jgi:uridine kinase
VGAAVGAVSRAALLAELTKEIDTRGARRIGVDGVDGAGKTWLADELAERIEHATRVRVDDFLNPPDIRYRLGRDSPEGFFLDSFDYEAFERAIVGANTPVVIADGIFLHRDELVGLWDFSIWLEVPFSISIPRGAARGHGFGSPDPAALSNRRYVEGQRLYIARCDPQSRATVVIDNSDLADPRRATDREA